MPYKNNENRKRNQKEYKNRKNIEADRKCRICGKLIWFKSKHELCHQHLIAELNKNPTIAGKRIANNRMSIDGRKRVSESKKREKNPNWKGGVTALRGKHTNNRRLKKWRKAVFKRDDWTCQICGKKGGELEANHIGRWIDFPKDRYATWNGETLCKKCHRKITSIQNSKSHYHEFIEMCRKCRNIITKR